MMPDLKKHLTDLIEAFAAARASGNQLLIQQSGATLIQFLESVDLQPVDVNGEQDGEG